MGGRVTCLYCDEPLVQSHAHPHWKHCPKCSPAWVLADQNRVKFAQDAAYAAWAANDKRGRPTIGGERQ